MSKRTHPLPVPVLTWYDHETGKIICEKGGRKTSFSCDEVGYVKLTKFLILLAPLEPKAKPRRTNPLPKPTEEQLEHAFRYANTAGKGYRKQEATDADLLAVADQLEFEGACLKPPQGRPN